MKEMAKARTVPEQKAVFQEDPVGWTLDAIKRLFAPSTVESAELLMKFLERKLRANEDTKNYIADKILLFEDFVTLFKEEEAEKEQGEYHPLLLRFLVDHLPKEFNAQIAELTTEKKDPYEMVTLIDHYRVKRGTSPSSRRSGEVSSLWKVKPFGQRLLAQPE